MVCFVKALVNTILLPVLDMLLQGSTDIYACHCKAGYTSYHDNNNDGYFEYEVLAQHWLRVH